MRTKNHLTKRDCPFSGIKKTGTEIPACQDRFPFLALSEYDTIIHRVKKEPARADSFNVGEGGFEPPKPKQQIYSLPHLTALELPHIKSLHNFIQAYCKAGGQTRTPDLLITNQLLYQLSYTSL